MALITNGPSGERVYGQGHDQNSLKNQNAKNSKALPSKPNTSPKTEKDLENIVNTVKTLSAENKV
nr:hypothetical protein [Nitrosopumilus sp.]